MMEDRSQAQAQIKLLRNNILFIATDFPWEQDFFNHIISNASKKEDLCIFIKCN